MAQCQAAQRNKYKTRSVSAQQEGSTEGKGCEWWLSVQANKRKGKCF